jgi:hypothetical protein
VAIKFNKNNLTKSLVKNYKLTPYLDKYLSSEVTDFEFRTETKISDDAWHPSSHCTPTPRELYDFATSDEKQKSFSTALYKSFIVGHFWHQLLQKAVLDLELAQPAAIECSSQRVWGEDSSWGPTISTRGPRAKPFNWVKGAGDVAPCSIPYCGDYLVDFKTMGGHDYKQNGLPAWCAHKYEAQINIYMDLFDLEQGLIVCIQKDSPHEFKEFEFKRNQPLIDAIYSKWIFVSGCLELGEAPSPEDDELFEYSYQGPIAQ